MKLMTDREAVCKMATVSVVVALAIYSLFQVFQ